MALFAVTLLSCQNTECIDDFTENAVMTRVAQVSDTLKLEDTEKGYLKSDTGSVCLPWAANAETSVPDDIRKDVKESDGWRVLYTNVRIEGYPAKVTDADVGTNYLLLYNRKSGVLKGFVYLKHVQTNNYGQFVLSTDRHTTLFNFVPYFALPMNSEDSPQQITTSVLTRDGFTQGFGIGWNCFQIELAYDENSMNEELSITAFAMNKGSLQMNGTISTNSSGTIVSTVGGSSGILNGVASLVGDAAKNWINKNLGSSSSTNTRSIIGSGASLLISSGLSKVFGSFLGSSKSVSDLQFTTNGYVTITGESSLPSSGYIPPLAGIKLDALNENLGVWNLVEVPKYECENYATLHFIYELTNTKYYTLNFVPNYEVKTNPALKDDHMRFSAAPVQYDSCKWGPEQWGIYTDKKRYDHVRRKKDVKYIGSKVYDAELSYDVIADKVNPDFTTSDNKPAGNIELSDYSVGEKYGLQITNTHGNDSKLYSVKTFIPQQGFRSKNGVRPSAWTYEKLKKEGYVTYSFK